MKKRKFALAFIVFLAFGLFLGGCGNGDDNEDGAGGNNGDDENKFSVAMVTDIGGVDDKSFNQSAWEGLKAFGDEHGKKKGDQGYDYLQSNSDQDYVPNLNKLVRRNFDVVFGIGYLLAEPIGEIAEQQKETNFGIVDDVVEKDNVVSILFKEQEVSFLAGVAAAKETKAKNIGFIGGNRSDVITRFEAGFRAGIASVDPSIKVQVQYVGSFGDAAGGKAAANQMYSAGADIIFHAAGGTGNGVFAEAKERKAKNPNANIWVIGVDSDQYDEGKVKAGDQEHNVTLTSALKRVDVAVKDVSERAMNGDFPGGETITYGLADDGVKLSETGDHLGDETLNAVKEWEDKLRNGEVTPPGTEDEMKTFLEDLGVQL